MECLSVDCVRNYLRIGGLRSVEWGCRLRQSADFAGEYMCEWRYRRAGVCHTGALASCPRMPMASGPSTGAVSRLFRLIGTHSKLRPAIRNL